MKLPNPKALASALRTFDREHGLEKIPTEQLGPMLQAFGQSGRPYTDNGGKQELVARLRKTINKQEWM